MIVSEQITLPCFLHPQTRFRAFLCLGGQGHKLHLGDTEQVIIRMLCRSVEPVQSRLRRTAKGEV